MMHRDVWSQAAMLCIDGYQRHLSPRKGYSCAHRVLHGGDAGCSAFVKRAIGERGLRAAWPLCRQRFEACKRAACVLRQSRTPLSSPSPFESSTSDSPRSRNRLQRWVKRQQRHCKQCEWCNPCDAVHVCEAARAFRGLPRAFDLCFDCGPADTGCIDCGLCLPCV